MATITRLYPAPLRGRLWLDSWAGRVSHPVDVLGETPKRYRVRALAYIPLKDWPAGYVALVPLRAVTFDPAPTAEETTSAQPALELAETPAASLPPLIDGRELWLGFPADVSLEAARAEFAARYGFTPALWFRQAGGRLMIGGQP